MYFIEQWFNVWKITSCVFNEFVNNLESELSIIFTTAYLDASSMM